MSNILIYQFIKDQFVKDYECQIFDLLVSEKISKNAWYFLKVFCEQGWPSKNRKCTCFSSSVCVCVCDGKVEFGFATCVQIQSDNQGAHQTLPKAEDQWEKLELSFINQSFGIYSVIFLFLLSHTHLHFLKIYQFVVKYWKVFFFFFLVVVC